MSIDVAFKVWRVCWPHPEICKSVTGHRLETRHPTRTLLVASHTHVCHDTAQSKRQAMLRNIWKSEGCSMSMCELSWGNLVSKHQGTPNYSYHCGYSEYLVDSGLDRTWLSLNQALRGSFNAAATFDSHCMMCLEFASIAKSIKNKHIRIFDFCLPCFAPEYVPLTAMWGRLLVKPDLSIVRCGHQAKSGTTLHAGIQDDVFTVRKMDHLFHKAEPR